MTQADAVCDGLCPAGKYGNGQTGMGSEADACTGCQSGRYGAGCQGTACALGRFGPQGTMTVEEATCDDCPAGWTTESTGASACTVCPMNHYCAGGVGKVSCPGGKVLSAGTEGVNAEACKCPPMTYVSSGGDCVECPTNWFSSQDSTACTSCSGLGNVLQCHTCLKPWPPSTLEKVDCGEENLVGTIPAFLGDLVNTWPTVKKVLLHGNQLTGTIPPELGKLNLISEKTI